MNRILCLLFTLCFQGLFLMEAYGADYGLPIPSDYGSDRSYSDSKPSTTTNTLSKSSVGHDCCPSQNVQSKELVKTDNSIVMAETLEDQIQVDDQTHSCCDSDQCAGDCQNCSHCHSAQSFALVLSLEKSQLAGQGWLQSLQTFSLHSANNLRLIRPPIFA